MSKTEKTYRRMLFRRLVSALLIFLLVFFVVELLSRWVSTTSTAPFGDNIRSDQKILIGDYSGGGGIVAIGDSIIARGFYPELFSTLLANKLSITYAVYNLGVEAAGLPWQKATFDQLAKKRLPQVVILNVSIHRLNIYGMTHDSDYPPHFDMSENSLDYYNRCMVNGYSDLTSKIYCKIAKHSYFLRLVHYYHTEVNDSESAIFDPRKTRYKNLILLYPAVSSMGFSPNFGALTKKEAASNFVYEAMLHTYKDSFAHFKLGTSQFDKLIDDLNKHSVKVILVLMPAYQPVMRRVYNELALPKNKVIIKMLEQYSLKKKVAFVNLFEELQDPLNFQDPIHMNLIGATKATSLLANKIFSKQYTHPKGYLDKDIYQYVKKNSGGKS